MQEQKYKTINLATASEITKFTEIERSLEMRPLFHITPPHGLLNDPNGFCFFNNQYHLFYQWFPFDTYHGMKHWMHLTSNDLLNWKRHGSKITPKENYESHGAYSGSAFVENNNAYLFYTGNIKKGSSRDANQCLALLDNTNAVTKYSPNPVIKSVPKGYTGHVRDPKIVKHNEHYYMLLGAQREADLSGAIIIYQSDDLLSWEFKGELDLQFSGEFLTGYMFECPDLLNVDGHDVLIFSPQGSKANGSRFHNRFNVIYCLGSINFEKLTFEVEHWDELDRGFDFYAQQTMANTPDEQTLIAWAGTDEELPSRQFGWVNCLTLPRTLSILNRRLYQQPKILQSDSFNKRPLEINKTNIPIKLEQLSFSLDVNEFNGNIKISIETKNKKLLFSIKDRDIHLDRSQYNHHPEDWEFGSVRHHRTNYDITDVKFICDQSIIEIYLNNGRDVFTCLFFPENEEHRLNILQKEDTGMDIKLNYLTI
ncbi:MULTISPECIES: glycoside hydrolase family 32 protein [Vibrio]|uniref:glycoside hydrolase family 32 protein n=1 Tax=Vibrio TaxID=662 RepID=UPI0002E6A5C9|nr:glycoside hydrolase family 32 protein [Vibrio tasmaniensis]OEF91787.1 sucrose-6-phosphate hydrolase [Vibrio tasmaniensis 1F-155]PMO79384.1 sucrose-6-phosphate hydrolase [Vibrio tasmaniensis]